jgi:hypothetical protein
MFDALSLFLFINTGKTIHNFARPLLSMSLFQSTNNLVCRQRFVQKAKVFPKLTAAKTKGRITREVRSLILICYSVTTVTLWCCVSTSIYMRCYQTRKLKKYVHCAITLMWTWRILKKSRISRISPRMDKSLKTTLFQFCFLLRVIIN